MAAAPAAQRVHGTWAGCCATSLPPYNILHISYHIAPRALCFFFFVSPFSLTTFLSSSPPPPWGTLSPSAIPHKAPPLCSIYKGAHTQATPHTRAGIRFFFLLCDTRLPYYKYTTLSAEVLWASIDRADRYCNTYLPLVPCRPTLPATIALRRQALCDGEHATRYGESQHDEPTRWRSLQAKPSSPPYPSSTSPWPILCCSTPAPSMTRSWSTFSGAAWDWYAPNSPAKYHQHREQMLTSISLHSPQPAASTPPPPPSPFSVLSLPCWV